jgi:hypothetical protein
MYCMAEGALTLAKRLMKELVLQSLLKMLVADKTEGGRLRRPDQGFLIGGVRFMA